MNEPQPVPPENVRIVFDDDGSVVPVELVYQGRQNCGCAQWLAVAPIAINGRRAHVACDMIPAQTEIALCFSDEIPR